MPPTDQVSVRKAVPADHDDVSRLSRSVDELHRESLPWMFRVPDVEPRPRAYLESLLGRDDAVVYVADAIGADGLVGVAFGLMRAMPAFPVFVQQRYGVLDGLVVDDAWRRRGIGKQLVQAVESWALDLGAQWLEMNVYEFNVEARRFYDALGYGALSTKLSKRPVPNGNE